MKRKRRALLITVGLLIAVGIIPAWRVWREAKRAYATHHLIAAIKALNVEAVRAYLDDGADPNVCETPETTVTFWQALKAAFLKRPLPFKPSAPNADEEPKPEYPALFVALTPRGMDDETLSSSDKQRCEQTALLLLAHDAKVKNVPDPEVSGNQAQDNTPLIKAVEYQLPDLVQQLLEKGADPDMCGVNGYSPLIRAAAQRDTSIVQQLLARGAKPNARTRHYGYTALMQATIAGQKANAQSLIRYKANVNAQGEHGESALDLAQLSHYNDIVKMLQQAGAGYERTESAALFRAIRRNDVKAVQKLVKGYVRADSVDRSDANLPSALMVAVEMGYSRSSRYAGQPPRNNLPVIRVLLDLSAYVNQPGRDGVTTALTLARRHSSRDVLRLLNKAQEAN